MADELAVSLAFYESYTKSLLMTAVSRVNYASITSISDAICIRFSRLSPIVLLALSNGICPHAKVPL